MITSTDNKRIKNVISLIQKGKIRREQDAFVIEGVKLFEEVPDDEILEVYVSENFKYESDKLNRIPYEVVKEEVFKKCTDTLTPQGILCVVKRRHYNLDDYLDAGKASLFLVLETVQDPGNLGTIMRTAEGAGVSCVIMNRDTVDLYNPKTVRSTMGSIFRQPFVYVDNLHETIDRLKDCGVKCYAAHLKGRGSCYDEDYSGPTAFFIGNEGNGLTDETADLADTYIRIPMGGKLESLNAAVSAAILTYEAARQRMK